MSEFVGKMYEHWKCLGWFDPNGMIELIVLLPLSILIVFISALLFVNDVEFLG